MDCKNIYESDQMICATGGALRPGGIELTEYATNFCGFEKGSRVLDVGCGTGMTLEHLSRKYKLKTYGIDPSRILIEKAKSRNPQLEIIQARGENLPFENACMDGALADCTLSLMSDIQTAIREAGRVLKPGGWFVIADVYARRPEHIGLLEKFSAGTCLRGLHSVERLKDVLGENGFEIELFADRTELLKKLMVKIIFEYGSMNAFWSKAASCKANALGFQNALSKCKAGYFLMIARKEL